jgi:nucleotide-binding universal stress UspA family protein
MLADRTPHFIGTSRARAAGFPQHVRALAPMPGPRQDPTIKGNNNRCKETAMSKPIVVGIDPLAPAQEPFTLGVALARISGAPLIVAGSFLHDPLSDAVSSGLIESDLREHAARELEKLVGDRDAEIVIVGGRSASHALHDIAVERDAGLIVVGSSRRGLLGRIAPGTTAERLLHGSSCPVAVAPNGLDDAWSPEKIGVGYIELGEGRTALKAAVTLARATGASLEVVTAVVPREWSHSAVVEPYQRRAGVEASKDAAKKALQRALDGLGMTPPPHGEVVIGEPVDVLVDLSGRVDLVVCGSRGYGPIQSVLLGGVSHGLLRDARAPVIVVPRGAEAALDELLAGSRAAS